jgi:catechol 2,3-dioxygenase-like lactoylglutathione lyase family enzyme
MVHASSRLLTGDDLHRVSSGAGEPGPAGRRLSASEGASHMLKDAEAFSGFAVDDVPRAKEFYGTVLGLEVADASLGVNGADVPAGLELRVGSGTRVMVYPKPDHAPATFTILNFLVRDIERTVDELTARGVRFEHYETPKTDDKGIHRRPEVRPVAWFRDPAGNILAVIEA